MTEASNSTASFGEWWDAKFGKPDTDMQSQVMSIAYHAWNAALSSRHRELPDRPSPINSTALHRYKGDEAEAYFDALEARIAQMEEGRQAEIEHAVDVAVGEFQSGIYNFLVKECGDSIDGGGCDSGDPLDFTLSEISQALNIKAEAAEADVVSLAAMTRDAGLLEAHVEALKGSLAAKDAVIALKSDTIKNLYAQIEKHQADEKEMVAVAERVKAEAYEAGIRKSADECGFIYAVWAHENLPNHETKAEVAKKCWDAVSALLSVATKKDGEA